MTTSLEITAQVARLETELQAMRAEKARAEKAEHERQCRAAREELVTLAAQSADAVARRKRDEHAARVRRESTKTDSTRAHEAVLLARLTEMFSETGALAGPYEWLAEDFAVGPAFFPDVRYALRARGIEAVRTNASDKQMLLCAYDPAKHTDRIPRRTRSPAGVELDPSITLGAFERACVAYDAHWIGKLWPHIQALLEAHLAQNKPDGPRMYTTYRVEYSCAPRLSWTAIAQINDRLASAKLFRYGAEVRRVCWNGALVVVADPLEKPCF